MQLSLYRPPLDQGQVKRQGIPRLNRAHPLAQGMQVAMLDVGGHVYDFARGNTIFYGLTKPARGQSPYGTGFNWPGSGGTTLSYGCYERVGFVLDGVGGNPSVDPESQVSVFSNLGGRGTGAGFSFASAFYLTDASFGEQFIFGRPSRAQEAAPFANWSLQARSAGDGGVGIAYFYSNNGTLNQCGGGATIGSNNVSYNALKYTSVATTNTNTSSGSAVCTQFQQGKQVNQSSGVVLLGTNSSNGVDGESQLMMGSIYHVDTTQAFQCASGFVYYGYVWNRALTPEEVKELHYHPYCMFLWPEDDIFATIFGVSGGSNTFTISPVEGTYTLTGKSQILNSLRLLKPSQGSYTITGEAVTNNKGKGLAAVQGSYSLTGEPQTSNRGINIAASEGTYTITGKPQTLSVTIPAAEGTYSISGKPQSFAVALSIHCSQGTYSITGNPQVLGLSRFGQASTALGGKMIYDFGNLTERLY